MSAVPLGGGREESHRAFARTALARPKEVLSGRDGRAEQWASASRSESGEGDEEFPFGGSGLVE